MFTIAITDEASNAAKQTFTLTIQSVFAVTTPPTLLAGMASVSYAQPLSAVNGKSPYTWSLNSGALPLGLTLSAAGTISGTPLQSGTSNFTLRAGDSSGSAVLQNFTIVIADGISYTIDKLATLPEGTGIRDLAIDSSRNLYVAGFSSQVVRKVSAAGALGIFAGTGVAGYSGDGGKATEAQLSGPQGIGIDPANNVYIAEMANNRIRMVTSQGIIKTVVGTGAWGPGGDGGPPAEASLNNPWSLAVNDAGDLFFSDTGSNRIRLVSNGMIRTIAGLNPALGGTAINSTLNAPAGLALDAAGNLYIADSGSNRIFRVRPLTSASDLFVAYLNGAVTTIAGSGIPGSGPDQLHQPEGVAADGAGNVYIADCRNYRILKLAPSGNLFRIAGTGTAGQSGDGGPANQANIGCPSSLKLDEAGNVFFTDRYNGRVNVLRPASRTSGQ